MRTITIWLASVAGLCLAHTGFAHAGSRNATESVAKLVRAGSADWRASCRWGKALCVKTRAFKHHLRCTGGGQAYKVSSRSSHATRGLAKLGRVVSAYRRAGRRATKGLARVAAPAFLIVASNDHERFLRTRFPRHLTFDPRDSIGQSMSVIRMRRWIQRLESNVAHLVTAYREAAAVARRGNRRDIGRLATERIAAVLLRAATLLRTARIPKSIATSKKYAREMTAAYCDELAKQARPLQQRAKVALRRLP